MRNYGGIEDIGSHVETMILGKKLNLMESE